MENQQQQNNFQLRQNQTSQVQQQYNVEQGSTCRHCGQHTLPGADICEHCGTWQLEGKCCFCYTPVRSGQKFCGSCGNAPEGVVCANCGTHSLFDFCPKCQHPVSKGAPEYLEQVKNSPEMIEIRRQMQAIEAQIAAAGTSAATTQTAAPEPDWLTKLQNYTEQFKTDNLATEQQASPTIKNSFVFESAGKDVTADLQHAALSAAKVGAAKSIEQQRQELEKQIADLQNRTFSSNQEARRFYMSIEIALPKMTVTRVYPEPSGWRCNFANNVHQAPSECACPAMGGHWLNNNGPVDLIVDITYTNI